MIKRAFATLSLAGALLFVVPAAAGAAPVVAASVTDATTTTADGGPTAFSSEASATAIWLGVGALGIGGIAAVAVIARRRAHAAR